jgi:hypothetical protein
MRKLFLLFCALFLSQVHSQARYKYHLYLYNSTSAPTFATSGSVMVYSGSDPGLSSFFSGYTIYSFGMAHPTSEWEEVSRVLYVETSSATLAANLVATYPGTYRKYDDITNVSYQLDYWPNDYGTTTPTPPNLGASIARGDLDYLNVGKAWHITSGTGVTIGISDARIKSTDTDFAGKVQFLNPGPYQSSTYNPADITTYHGTLVAGIAAAQGDNAYGSTGVCYDCNIVSTAYGIPDNILRLAQSGVRVINMSWSSPFYDEDFQTMINHIVEDYQVVLVSAAGNFNSYQTSTDKHCGQTQVGVVTNYPASYDNVISVTTVEHKNAFTLPLSNSLPNQPSGPSIPGMTLYTQLQGSFGNSVNGNNPNNPVGLIFNGWPEYCGGTITSPNGLVPHSTTNPRIDIMAPSNDTFRFDYFAETGTVASTGTATSGASPMVAGAAALMLSVSDCLAVKEVDRILKLTSKDTPSFSINAVYEGQIGAGVLDVGEAVEFVNQMKSSTGNAIIKDHKFRRFDLDLKRINNKLTVQNVSFTAECNANFEARTMIDIQGDSDFKPTTGVTSFGINSSIDICSTPARPAITAQQNNAQKSPSHAVSLSPNPNTGSFEVSINNVEQFQNKQLTLQIIDINGRIVFEQKIKTDTARFETLPVEVTSVANGVYFLRLSAGDYSETIKYIKR